ncbi:hypothetical protein [Micromonospora sp. NBC_01813]|uniref:hypothetical protein n=1 Tax=Micromonospora sp. NBC_01813 TaxID=2975988 RepID=UPI002DD8173B|nr:hypothetical protein [Micromonospora sp. NBC_01813]WSA07672.1 hypothetical protein OG958_26095 [Micromonospora sp. NBC_01813]
MQRLVTAADLYAAEVSDAYDEVIEQVVARVADAGSLGKLDLGALSAWKRLRADTPWMAQLMSCPEYTVRQHTQRAVAAAQDQSRTVPEAAAAARSALTPLPGFSTGDALASVVCFVAAPKRLAVYDRRAHEGLRRLGLALDDRPGRYGRYLTLLEQCRDELADQGHRWSARHVDLALFQLGGQKER